MKALAPILLLLGLSHAAAPISAEFGGTGRAAMASGRILVDSSLRVVGYRTPAQLGLITTITLSDSLNARLPVYMLKAAFKDSVLRVKRDTNTWTGANTFTATLTVNNPGNYSAVNTNIPSIFGNAIAGAKAIVGANGGGGLVQGYSSGSADVLQLNPFGGDVVAGGDLRAYISGADRFRASTAGIWVNNEITGGTISSPGALYINYSASSYDVNFQAGKVVFSGAGGATFSSDITSSALAGSAGPVCHDAAGKLKTWTSYPITGSCP